MSLVVQSITMVTLKCPHCGMEFTADSEEEAKKMMKKHGMEQHAEKKARKD